MGLGRPAVCSEATACAVPDEESTGRSIVLEYGDVYGDKPRRREAIRTQALVPSVLVGALLVCRWDKEGKDYVVWRGRYVRGVYGEERRRGRSLVESEAEAGRFLVARFLVAVEVPFAVRRG